MLAFFCVTFRVCFSFLSFFLFIPAVGVPLGAENLKLHIDDLRPFIRIARVHRCECYYTVVVCMHVDILAVTPHYSTRSWRQRSDETLSHRIYLRMIPYYGGPAMGACLRLPRIPAHVTQQARCNPSCMLLARAFTGGRLAGSLACRSFTRGALQACRHQSCAQPAAEARTQHFTPRSARL